MQSTSSIIIFAVIALTCTVRAELTPFYNFNVEGSKKPDNNDKRNRNLRSPGRRNLGHHGRYSGGDHYYECESFYSKSVKKSGKKKSHKREKHTKSDKKKCKGTTVKPDGTDSVSGRVDLRPHKDFMRFIMVREEAGTPVPGAFGVGDSLALNGQVYYWEDYEDNLMSDVPVGTFVTLCTGISEEGDDLLCTYEIVLGLLADRAENGSAKNGNAGSASSSTIESVGAFVANGPNYVSENSMIVTGTEFEFSKYQSGTMITTEDLVNPYLYADLYLS